MKSIKTRLVSAFLLIMTILSLFPTTAFAATSTGTGINPPATRIIGQRGFSMTALPTAISLPWPQASCCTALIVATAIVGVPQVS